MHHTKAIIGNLPAELSGLNSWSFVTADQVLTKNPEDGAHAPGQRIFMDVAYRVAQNAHYKEGYYFLVGGYAPAGSPGGPFPQVAIFSGNAPILSYSLDDVGGSGVGYMEPLCAVACVAPHASASFTKIVTLTNHAISGGLSLYMTASDSSTIETKAAWSLGGDSLAGAPTPVVGWKYSLGVARDASTKYFYAAGKKTGSAGSTKVMTRKLYTANDTTDWTNITVPDDGNSDGYTKLVVSRLGFVMALTDFGTLDVGNGQNPTSFFTDTPEDVRDIAYSHRTNKFYRINNLGTVASTDAGSWSTGGPVTWTQEYTGLLSGVAGSPWLICPLELPYQGTNSNASLHEATTDAWFVIYHSDSGRTFVTRNWSLFYPVSIPGLFRHNGIGRRFPVNTSYMKFAGDRLFVFTPRGTAISGPLGLKPAYNNG